jgi:Ca-activated chloride channel homolog
MDDMDGMNARTSRYRRLGALSAMTAALLVVSVAAGQQPPAQDPDAGFRFKSGVELINVTAMVSDTSGRFVPGLLKDDFLVYEDGVQQPVMHFSAERVPVSLGIALDTSGSMNGEKIAAAQRALERFLYQLLDEHDEIFLYRFNDRAVLVQNWTNDRQLLSQALGRVAATGGTAMYDAVADAVRLTTTGHNRKKALVLLSDGNDTTSKTSLREVKQLIRESEALVYAIGVRRG